jgi:tetratricopeptide (TPR) repeat protein
MGRRWFACGAAALALFGSAWGLAWAVNSWRRDQRRELAQQAMTATLRRATGLVEQGRWARAEALLVPVVRQGGAEADPARFQLAWLYHRQLRMGAAHALVQELCERAEDRAGMLRQLWLLDDDATQFEGVRADLERAGRLAPDDDRVWLGKANLAIRSGRLADARSWLDACLRSRPEDPDVWQARLEWARGCERADRAAAAARHLPAGWLGDDEREALAAWFASRRGDAEAERRALEALLEQRPTDSAALERLALLELERGEAARAAGYRRRKNEIDRLKDRYRRALHQPPRLGAEEDLARLAEALGRWFEAHGWWSLACLRDPDRAEFRARALALAARLRPQPRSSLPPVPAPAGLPGSDDHESPDSGGLAFRDDAEAAGLRFTFHNGATPARQLPETMSGGIAVLDYDGDGWLDVYAVQGGPFPPPAGTEGQGQGQGQGDRLFRNRGDGTFEDVTARSGLAALDGTRGYGHGVATGDYDNDGHTDLFRTGWRSYTLFRNRGDGTFEDATAAAGLGGDRDWPTSAALADLDGDGDLDLYVCHYLDWDSSHPRACPDSSAQGRPGYCSPRDFPALPDHLFRNDGGRFVDVTAAAGIVDRDGRGLGVVAADLDDDNRVDLFVANDATPQYLFHNLGGLRFEEVALDSGVAANAEGGFQAGMGIACGDQDGDGRLDLVVTNFYGESTTLFRNLGNNVFGDATATAGLASQTRFLLGFGVCILDADNDGWLDLATANGHVNDYRPRVPYAMPAQLLIGMPGGRLIDVSATAGAPWQVPRVGRGLAVADLDNDGACDLLLVAQNEPLVFLHNLTRGGHHVTFILEGTASNRDGVGARLTLVAGGRRQVSQRLGGGSYLSASAGRLHFGLGTADRVDSLEVRWPSGRVDRFSQLAADVIYRLREGCPELRPVEASSRKRPP